MGGFFVSMTTVQPTKKGEPFRWFSFFIKHFPKELFLHFSSVESQPDQT